MNKLECIDDIIKKHKGGIEYVDDNPDYVVRVGLPNINLEIRTSETIELYVLVDVNTSEDLIKDIDEAYDALVSAAGQVPEKGERDLHQWIQLFNAGGEQLKKYELRIAKLLARKMSKSPQLPLSIDTRPYSKEKQLYHQMDKPGLN